MKEMFGTRYQKYQETQPVFFTWLEMHDKVHLKELKEEPGPFSDIPYFHSIVAHSIPRFMHVNFTRLWRIYNPYDSHRICHLDQEAIRDIGKAVDYCSAGLNSGFGFNRDLFPLVLGGKPKFKSGCRSVNL